MRVESDPQGSDGDTAGSAFEATLPPHAGGWASDIMSLRVGMPNSFTKPITFSQHHHGHCGRRRSETVRAFAEKYFAALPRVLCRAGSTSNRTGGPKKCRS